MTPAVETAHVHPRLVDALVHQQGLDPARERAVVTQHQDRLAQDLGEMQTAVDEDQRLARARRAVDHPMPFAHAARELLLLEVHHAQDVGQHVLGFFVGRLGLEQAALADADLREQVPADPVDPGQIEPMVEVDREHVPQARLEDLHILRLGHLVLADHALRRQHLTQIARIELAPRDP